ncbi:BREX-1 system adenine-specific DNA-methyltransferase PglX [Flavisolibacter sp. BT320]|nr:BREX-1 system adenine-specific DNA-methyltransferase PglX [Flavisolibacter longurius]
MNTTLLKTFGQKARTLLIDGVTRKLYYWGFDKDGNVTEQPEALSGGFLFREGVFDDPTVPHLWQSLKEEVSKEGLHEVAERAAYIWFNRLMALQILGKNGYEQPLLEPVSVEEQTPVLVKRARSGQYDFLNKTEQERLKKILTDYEKETQVFAILLIGFCHGHSLLNRVFGSIDDYTELLLPDDILSSGGFLDLLNNGGYITDEDYRQVELIGWLYQFYISEKKDQVFKKFKDGKKAEAKDIPAATQIFTPNWIVKYMVENTVGKIWLEKHPDSSIKGHMQYLVEAVDNSETSEPIIEGVKDLKLLDPASGSGHIMVEGFELLYKMYLEEYYPSDEAVESILKHNLYGLDIDLRAAQLAQFAVLMKAAEFYPDILKKNILPHIYAMPAPVHFTKEDVQVFLNEDGADYVKPLQDALHLMLQAQNLGSIMQFDISEEARTYILQQFSQWQQRKDLDLLQQELLNKLTPYLHILIVLTQQYEAIAANPPYMIQKNMNGFLKNYVNTRYLRSKSDLFAVFMDVCYSLLKKLGRYSMINQQSWMFLSSYDELRAHLLSTQTIDSLLHLGPRTFDELSGEVVQSTLFSISKATRKEQFATYYRLVELRDSETKRTNFLSRRNEFRFINQNNFRKIEGSPFIYWASGKVLNLFLEKITVNEVAPPRIGMMTTDNNRFLRKWHEISNKDIGYTFKDKEVAQNSEVKWFPYNKGGSYKKWYGNRDLIVNWYKGGQEIINNGMTSFRGIQFYFREGITWSDISSGDFASRFTESGSLFDIKGTSAFPSSKEIYFFLGFLNCKISTVLLKMLNPTLSFQSGDIRRLPYKRKEINDNTIISRIVEECVQISRNDWNSRETSYDFQNSTLVGKSNSLESSFASWISEVSKDFFKLHQNEEELNRIFIKIYDLEDELQSDIALEDITILQDELDYEVLIKLQSPFERKLLPLKKEVPIQQLISYSIGCFMGRYRLDRPNLQIAHPNPKPEETEMYRYISPVTGESHSIEIDEDGIIPLMGSKGNFRDDAYNRLRQFLVAVWGEDTLTQNINFIQECLNQDLEDYLVKRFWNYHVRMYSKRPIYWLFSSKKGAFQALVYMHRMNRFTVEKLREKYLLKQHIPFLRQEIARMETNLTSLSKGDQKKLDQLRKDLQECNDYDLLLKDIATKQIEFDLDDGVTRNYELFKGVVAPIK